MNNKKFILITLCLAFLLFFTGCDVGKGSLLEPEDAITAPKVTGAYQGVQEALENAVGSDIILKYVTVGESRLAFCNHDLDGDGSQEVLAFYKKDAEGAVPRINVLKYIDKKWNSVQDIEPVGNDILEVAFADIDNDKKDEVITGWNVFNSKQLKLSVFKENNGMLVKRASESYSNFTVCDIDNNGTLEIGTVLLDTVEKTSKVSFYNLNNDEFDVAYSTAADGNVTSYQNMKSGKMANGKTAVYLDGYKTQTSMITELIYFENNTVVNPFYDIKTKVNNKTLRYMPFESEDIDKDGIIEIPISTPANGKNTTSEGSKQYYIKWVSFNQTDEKECFTAWYSPDLSYYLKLNDNWINLTSVFYDTQSKTVTFSLWNSSQKAIGEDVLKVRVSENKNSQTNQNEYFVLHKNESHIWEGCLPAQDGGSFYVTQDDVKNMFNLVIN